MFPKRTPYRNRRLLDWMHGKPCQVQGPYCTNTNTVPAHSNSADYGKGMGQKADDCSAAICCEACHDWLDGRKYANEGPHEDRRFYHDRAIIRTIRMALDAGVL